MESPSPEGMQVYEALFHVSGITFVVLTESIVSNCFAALTVYEQCKTVAARDHFKQKVTR
jgi:hypothetical protein